MHHMCNPPRLQRTRMYVCHTSSQDVGMWGDGRDGTYGIDNPSSETYLTLNGLSVADDAVLGDYEIWGTASEGTK